MSAGRDRADWSDPKELKSFLAAWKCTKILQASGKKFRNSEPYQFICSEMKKSGFYKTVKQIRTKVFTEKAKYKKVSRGFADRWQ